MSRAIPGQLEQGTHLEWRLDVPLIVLEHERLSRPVRTDQDGLAVVWHELQVDLAGRQAENLSKAAGRR